MDEAVTINLLKLTAIAFYVTAMAAAASSMLAADGYWNTLTAGFVFGVMTALCLDRIRDWWKL